MRELICKLLEKKRELIKQISKLEIEVGELPEGKVNVMKSKGKYLQYYIAEGRDAVISRERKYAKKADIEKVRQYIQRAYDEEVLSVLYERIELIERLIESCKNKSIDKIYDDQIEARKMYISPLELPDEEYIEKWKKNMLLGENTYPKSSNIITENGEQVRSKTEKILADKLLKNNIPYVYEPKVILNDGRYLFPDFAILNVRLRKTYYHEHFGMMDNPEYSVRAIEKIEEYQHNGYWPGKNILYTFETQSRMPDMRNLDQMITTYLK